MPHLDQLCFYCSTVHQADAIKQLLHLPSPTSWLMDNVNMHNLLPPNPTWQAAKAELQFHITNNNFQIEIMRFTEGPHWLQNNSTDDIFISHVGLHLAHNEPWPDLPDCPLVQETRTFYHSAKHFHEKGSPQYGRTYHYRIHQMGKISIKLIRRKDYAQYG